MDAAPGALAHDSNLTREFQSAQSRPHPGQTHASRRCSTRVAVSLPAIVTFPHSPSATQTAIAATATELSPHGVFLAVAEPLQIGATVNLEICAPIGPTFAGQPSTSYITTRVAARVTRSSCHGAALVFQTAPTFETDEAL